MKRNGNKLPEGARKIHTEISRNGVLVYFVYWSPMWEEYLCIPHHRQLEDAGGKLIRANESQWGYHGDKEDAIETAKFEIRRFDDDGRVRQWEVKDTWNGGTNRPVVRFISYTPGGDGYNQCLKWLHDNTPFSWEEALKNQGYQINKA